MAVFKVLSKVGKTVRLDEDRWDHVLEHPEMENQIDRVSKTVVNPDEVRKSVHNPSVCLFYKFYNDTPVTEKFLLVAVKILNGEGFIVTAFFTDRMKKGGLIWKRKP